MQMVVNQGADVGRDRRRSSKTIVRHCCPIEERPPWAWGPNRLNAVWRPVDGESWIRFVHLGLKQA